MVVAGVAADTVRLQGDFLTAGIGYFAYFAGVSWTSMIGKSQVETEIPLDSAG
jgi:hypothetical protein